MLIIKQQPKKEPITIKHKLKGAEISLTIRPYDEDEIAAIREKNTTYQFAKDPETQLLQRVKIVDFKTLGEDVMDHLVVSFSGVGSAKDAPLEVTRENKLLLADIDPGKGEKAILEVMYETARSLSSVVKAEAEAEIKNS